VPSFGLYMVLYEALIGKIHGDQSTASAQQLIFAGGMAGKRSRIKS